MDKGVKLHVALLAGGTSGEREVSLNGSRQILANLDQEKYRVTQFDPATDLQKLTNESGTIDVALINLHGPGGEDGTVLGLLELLDIPYQGAGVLGSALAMNKDLTKQLYLQHGLPVAKWCVVRHVDEVAKGISTLHFPLVIKPICVGSSLGMTIAHNEAEAISGVTQGLLHDNRVMLEEYIEGREITVGVLGNNPVEALPLIEIIPDAKYTFFDYEAKYQPGATKEVCPAEIDDEVRVAAQQYALQAHAILQLKNYSRTDMMVTPDKRIYLLETNTIPGMTETSLFPQAAAAFGLSYGALLDRLIELALEK